MKQFFLATVLLATSSFSASAQLIDDFDNPQITEFDQPRMFLTDQSAGGNTQLTHEFNQGVLYIKGNIAPPRGQPGWASTVLPLSAFEQQFDASKYTGIELRINVAAGNLSLSANSNEITNFDYHAAPVVVTSDGKYHSVKIPFAIMKRAWSAQTDLNLETLSSISLVAFGLQPGSFEFAVDHIKFY